MSPEDAEGSTEKIKKPSENDILNIIIEETSWEEVISYIITEEGMDPWDIDIVELADAFLRHLRKLKEFNFKVPSRIIIVTSILLRMKAEILMWEEEEKRKRIEEEEEIDISKVPKLEPPIKRMPKRKVTLDELAEALGKAFKTKDIREKKMARAKKNFNEAVRIEEEKIDFEKKINDLYSRITDVLGKLRKGNLTFSELVPDWTREDIVVNFLPLLHLSTDGKVKCKQKELFKEIYIQLYEGGEHE